MKKIILGKNPTDTFKKKVSVPVLGADDAEIVFEFKRRTRTAYGKLADGHAAEVKQRGDAMRKEAADFRLEQFVGFSIESDAAFIVELATGWDLDDEFTLENVTRLLDEYGGAAERIIAAYRLAINEGHRGN